MAQSIAAVTLVVAEYDEAIAFFTQRLGFALVEDTPVAPGKRWVVVRPPAGGTALLLARATTPEQVARVGDQTGVRVFLFLQTDDFWRDHAAFRGRGVQFAEEPREEGVRHRRGVLDLRQPLDLVQPRPAEPSDGVVARGWGLGVGCTRGRGDSARLRSRPAAGRTAVDCDGRASSPSPIAQRRCHLTHPPPASSSRRSSHGMGRPVHSAGGQVASKIRCRYRARCASTDVGPDDPVVLAVVGPAAQSTPAFRHRRPVLAPR